MPFCPYGKTAGLLFSKVEFLYEFLIAWSVFTLEVVQKPASDAYHAQETVPGVVIALMRLEVVG